MKWKVKINFRSISDNSESKKSEKSEVSQSQSQSLKKKKILELSLRTCRDKSFNRHDGKLLQFQPEEEQRQCFGKVGRVSFYFFADD